MLKSSQSNAHNLNISPSVSHLLIFPKRLHEVLEEAEADLERLEGMSHPQRQEYFDDPEGFIRHEYDLSDLLIWAVGYQSQGSYTRVPKGRGR